MDDTLLSEGMWSAVSGIWVTSGGEVCVVTSYHGDMPADGGALPDGLVPLDPDGDGYFSNYYRQTLSPGGDALSAPVLIQCTNTSYILSPFSDCLDEQGSLFVCDGNSSLLRIIAPDGSCSSIQLSMADACADRLFSAPDGTAYLEYHRLVEEEDFSRPAAVVNLATGEMSEPLPMYDTLSYLEATPLRFTPNGAAYVKTLYGIYAYDTATGEMPLLCDFLDSGLLAEQVDYDFMPMEDGSFLATGWTDDYSQRLLLRLTPA